MGIFCFGRRRIWWIPQSFRKLSGSCRGSKKILEDLPATFVLSFLLCNSLLTSEQRYIHTPAFSCSHLSSYAGQKPLLFLASVPNPTWLTGISILGALQGFCMDWKAPYISSTTWVNNSTNAYANLFCCWTAAKKTTNKSRMLLTYHSLGIIINPVLI